MHKRIYDKTAVDDLVLLTDISEDGIVANLQARHAKDRIYTFIGPVLLSVNPFKEINGLYSASMPKAYEGKYAYENAPHVFAVAEDAYRAMRRTRRDQAILVSGESGAGKTEAAKKIMEYVAAVSGDRFNRGHEHSVKERLIQSNPVLEAFGNATTVRNNNSSRFGKYMELLFDFDGVPTGGRITKYLLEKPRVVAPAAGERSFHVFYQLLAGASDEERGRLSLGAGPEGFASLSREGTVAVVKALDDGEEYLEMRSAMGDVGFDAQLQEELVALAAAVLHISNVAGLSAKGAGSGGAALPIAAALLGVKDDALRGALTHRTIVTAGEAIRTPLSDGEAAATRDALAKALYSATFSAVVTEVNEAIKTDASHLTTGILDIYGFEIFGVNSFEQLCINYANEKLQQLFIELTVLSEQQEYAEEGIAWTPVPFFDNRVVCELIEGTKPAGVFAWLDEECVMPQGSDTTLYEKLAKNFVSHKHFAATTEKDLTKALFTITHYAGDVGYSPAGMLEKNRDTLFRDLHEMIAASAKPFVAQLLGPLPGKATQKRPVTAGFQFRQQMGELVKVLGKCEPHYIRCIKPNDHKKSGSFDADRVRHQVRYLGLLENVQVRRAGFAYRQLFTVFATRYRLLSSSCWPKGSGDARADCVAILREHGVSDSGYQLGKSKLFVRDPATVFGLEEARGRRLGDIARILQAGWRAYKTRKFFLELREKSFGIFGGRKRRRGSRAFYFLGDYCGAGASMEVSRIMKKTGAQHVLFADVVQKINRQGKAQPRVLLLTERSLHTLTPGKFKQGNCVPLGDVTKLSMSTYADGYMVVHVKEGAKDCKADLLFESMRKAEIATAISETEALGPDFTFAFADEIAFRSKASDLLGDSKVVARTITFAEDASLKTLGAVAVLSFDKKKPEVIAVGCAPALGSEAPLQLDKLRTPAPIAGGGEAWKPPPPLLAKGSAPAVMGARPPLVPPRAGGLVRRQSFSSFPAARVLHNFAARDGEELTLNKGSMVRVLEQKDPEWWNGEYNGKVGLFPANHVELL